MKFYYIILLFPMVMAAQQTNGCAKTATLYSRELFRGPVTVERTMAISGYDAECREENQPITATTPQLKGIAQKPKYQYFPIDAVQQDMNGRDLFLGVVTDALVKYLVYDRPR